MSKLISKLPSREQSNADLARRAGLDRSTVAKIRDGVELVTFSRIEALFASLNEDLEEEYCEYDVVGVLRKSKKQELKYPELGEILNSDRDCLFDRVIGIYQACRPPGWTRPFPTKMPEMLIDLENMPPGDIGYQPIFQFIAKLTLDAEMPTLICQKLQTWLKQNVINTQQLLEQVQHRAEAEDFHLMVWLQPSPQQKNRYLVKAWLAFRLPEQAKTEWEQEKLLPELEDSVFSVSEISQVLRQLLIECGSRCALSDLTIEFFLPHHLFNHEIDRIAIEEDWLSIPIGVDCKIIVRSEERLKPHYSLKRKEWEKKWQQLKHFSYSPCAELLASGDCDPKALYVKLGGDNVIGCRMTVVPNLPAKGSIFDAILQSATPVAVWLRQNLPENNFQVTLDRILTCCITELPEVVKSYRKEAFANPECPELQVGSHLALLWEDPDRLPDTSPLMMP